MAFDPGEDCGIASIMTTAWRYPNMRELPALEAVSFAHTQLTSWSAVIPVLIVAERYVYTSRKMTFQPHALEVIGALRYLAHVHKGVEFELQSRNIQSRIPNSVLTQNGEGWWLSTPEGHANVAAKHLLAALSRRAPSHDAVRGVAGTIQTKD